MVYSQSEIDSMRRDALRRTREMHSNAQKMESDVQAEAPPPEKPKEAVNNTAQQGSNNPLGSLFSGIFSNGKIDNDKLIIIMLIIILAKEGADLKLLIALGYIIM